MNSIEENILLDIITDVSKSFLENDMSIEVNEVTNSEDSNINKYYALVSFDGDMNIFCIVSIDEELLNHILKAFLPHQMSDEEKDEMICKLPDEIVNPVAGLSIARFPKKYENLVMSVPLALDKKEIETLEINYASASKKIKTMYGYFVCSVIKVKIK